MSSVLSQASALPQAAVSGARPPKDLERSVFWKQRPVRGFRGRTSTTVGGTLEDGWGVCLS